MKSSKKIVVVGAGPAGMMAAIRAAELHQDVYLIEKNPSLGRKLLLSGKGRCNLTNTCGLDLFIGRFSKNGQFLRDAFKVFFNQDLIDFFEKKGLSLKVERQLRVFPAADKSSSVLGVLKTELRSNDVKVIYRSKLKDVVVENNQVRAILLVNNKRIAADRVILATGGLSYPATGSTGEGLDIARKLGHGIVAPLPGLVPLKVSQEYPRLLEGITLKNIRIKFTAGRREIISDIGELVFTSFGVSGPLVLTLSGQIVDWLSAKKNVYLEIDLKPALSKEQLEKRILREFKISPNKSIKNILKGFLPQRMVSVFIDIAGIPQDKKVNQITQSERNKLVSLFKGLRLDITGPRSIKEAMITRGGVALSDIDPRTMQSRKIQGLYFAGEMIDVDADCGGFNLQSAFSTGYLAGENAVRI